MAVPQASTKLIILAILIIAVEQAFADAVCKSNKERWLQHNWGLTP
jgi:hypothetical protein